jgi:prepilin-type N-terminal cleavage/methylation domain-containing protein
MHTPAGRLSLRQAFSLVEVIIALSIFSLMMLGFLSGTVLTRRIAESNIYTNTAMTVAQGYMEQIKSIEYHRVLNALNDPENVPIPTKGISALGGSFSEFDDPLYFDEVNEKDIVVDIIPDEDGSLIDGEPLTMDMRITLTGNNLNTGSNPVRAIEIVLEYEYLTPETIEPSWRSGSIRFVKSFVPTF